MTKDVHELARIQQFNTIAPAQVQMPQTPGSELKQLVMSPSLPHSHEKISSLLFQVKSFQYLGPTMHSMVPQLFLPGEFMILGLRRAPASARFRN